MAQPDTPDHTPDADEETEAGSSPPVSDPRLRETAEADAEDPTVGGSSDGDTSA